MKVNLEEISPTRQKLQVEIEPADLQAEEKKLLQRYAQQAKIPGFRPGKAPPDMVKRKFGKNIRDELKQSVLSRAYEHGVKEKNLKVLRLVDSDADQVDLDKGGTLEVTLDVQPEFELPNYTGLAVKAPRVEVAAEEIDETVNEIRKQQSRFEAVDRAAEEGDYVQVSYKGTVDGKALEELAPDLKIWGTQNKTWEEAGATEAGVPAVADGIIGMAKDDTKDTTMTIPDAFPVEELRGKEVSYHLEVHEVRERILPEINEEFLKAFGVETEEALRKQIEDDIRARKDQERNSALRRQVSDHLLHAVNFELPESAVEQESANIQNEILQQNRQRGLPEEEIEKHQEEIARNAAQAGRERVKLHLILARIAEKEKIEVQNDDFQRAIMSQAMQTRRKPEEIVKELQSDRNRVNALRQNLLFGKTLGFLVEKAEIEDVDPSEVPQT